MAPGGGAQLKSIVHAASDRTAERAKLERLEVEKQDLLRRVRERDERTAELSKQLSDEKERAQKKAEKYGAEAALREAADDARAAAEKSLRTLQARYDELASSNEGMQVQHVHGSAEAKARLERAEAARSELEATVRQLEAERNELRVEVHRLAPLLAAAEAEVRAERASGRHLLGTTQASLRASLQELEAERDTLRADVQQLLIAVSAEESSTRGERATCERLLEQMQRGHDRELSILQERVLAAMAEAKSAQTHSERLLEQARAAHQREEAMLRERCEAAEGRIDREAANAASAWREVEIVRAELHGSRQRAEALSKEGQRQAAHVATIEAALMQLRQDRALIQQAQTQMIGFTTEMGTRREAQLNEALAAVRSCRELHVASADCGVDADRTPSPAVPRGFTGAAVPVGASTSRSSRSPPLDGGGQGTATGKGYGGVTGGTWDMSPRSC